MNTMLVRKAHLDDISLIVEYNCRNAFESEGLQLDRAGVTTGVSAVLQDANKGVYYIAEDGEKSVGILMITREWSDWRGCWKWWLQSVYVLPEYRGRGVFDALLAQVEVDAIAEGVQQLALYMDQHNLRAEKAYVKNGFEKSHYLLLEKELFSKK